jgi:hypothetical protein
MNQSILKLDEVQKKISEGRSLLLAGDEAVLKQLPKGNWIGGTIPYFITKEHGGLVSRDLIFVTDISDIAQSISIAQYDKDSLAKVYEDGPKQGFSFILIPAASETHLSFAVNAPNYKSFGMSPLIGWIAGVHLDDLGKNTPKVFNGSTGAMTDDGAMVLRAELKPGKLAEIGIINLFEQGDGDTLTFSSDGFSAKDVKVNGAPQNFAAYLKEHKLDTRLPIVADYYGALINISFQGVDDKENTVNFYAPVFSGIRYKHAKPIADYVAAFDTHVQEIMGADTDKVVFSCNCILNYLFSNLENKKTGVFVGPVTFGEIAYQLLNQTLVYLEIKDI